MKNRSSATNFKAWPKAETPFERLHTDFGHWKGFSFLLFIDSFSNLITVWHVQSTGTEEICFNFIDTQQRFLQTTDGHFLVNFSNVTALKRY